MQEHHLLSEIGFSIIGAAAFGIPAFFLRVPLMLAYLLAGIVLGPHMGLGIIKSAESISILSEIGLILLMFILGLEIDLRKLKQAGKAVLVNGITQFLGCCVLAIIFFKAFGFAKDDFTLTYLAVACSLSSTLIVVKILSDQMILDSLTSRITLGILVLQDIWAIGFLALQPSLANLNGSNLAISLSKVAILVFCAWTLARYVLPIVFSRTGKHPELLLILAMAWCFGICGLANYLKLSLEMGALIAGVSIASFPYHLDIAAKISSLRDFFITLFFVSLGMQVPVPTFEVISLSLLITFFVYLSRTLTIFPVLYFLKYGNRASFLPALNLSQLSEFAIVLASLGVAYNHIQPFILSAFIISMVFTALISSFVIPGAHGIYLKLNPILIKMGFKDHISSIDTGSGKSKTQIVFLGFYRDASSLIYEMQKRYAKNVLEEILVVDFNPESHVKLKELGIRCVYGDIGNRDTLRNLDLTEAGLILCTIPDQFLKGTTNLKLVRILKSMAPSVPCIMTAEKIDQARELYSAGADYVLVPRIVNANYLADVLERVQSQGSKIIKSSAEEYLKLRSEVIS